MPPIQAMITRKQYLNFQGDADAKRTMHQAFYTQFANKSVVSYIAGKFSPEELVHAHLEDPNLNTIPLERWDDAARAIYPWIDDKLVKSTGQLWSLNTGVCTCKAAANILISRALATPVA